MLVARGKAGRVSGLLESLPADQKRIHQNDPLAVLTEPTSETATANPAADVAAAATTPLLEPTAPPMPAALALPEPSEPAPTDKPRKR